MVAVEAHAPSGLSPEELVRPEELERTRRLVRTGTALCGLVVVVAVIWGSVAISPNPAYRVRAAPLFGHWGFEPRPGVMLAVIVAAGVVGAGPRLARACPWWGLLAGAATASSIWSVVLNLPFGWDGLTSGFTNRFQYEPFAASIDDPVAFLRHFTAEISGYPIHVKGHPPGATLVPWLLDRIGFPGAGWFALVSVVGWGVAIAACLVATRVVAGEEAARRCAPVLVLLPGALWAVSADGLFAGVVACGVSASAIALVHRRYRFACLAGALFALGMGLTYGATAMVVIVAALGLYRRTWLPLLVIGATAALILTGVWMLAGFWWFDGLEATRGEYWSGVASRRPTPYFVLAGNPGALALAVGPAVFAGLAAVWPRLRERGPLTAGAVLPLGALAAVVAADLSLLSKAEVERIWLMFMPWLATASATSANSRRWLTAQAVLGITLLVVFGR